MHVYGDWRPVLASAESGAGSKRWRAATSARVVGVLPNGDISGFQRWLRMCFSLILSDYSLLILDIPSDLQLTQRNQKHTDDSACCSFLTVSEEMRWEHTKSGSNHSCYPTNNWIHLVCFYYYSGNCFSVMSGSHCKVLKWFSKPESPLELQLITILIVD